MSSNSKRAPKWQIDHIEKQVKTSPKDVKVLNKLFKKVYGYTPKQFFKELIKRLK